MVLAMGLVIRVLQIWILGMNWLGMLDFVAGCKGRNGEESQ
jgi:hypothetical protein